MAQVQGVSQGAKQTVSDRDRQMAAQGIAIIVDAIAQQQDYGAVERRFRFEFQNDDQQKVNWLASHFLKQKWAELFKASQQEKAMQATALHIPTATPPETMQAPIAQPTTAPAKPAPKTEAEPTPPAQPAADFLEDLRSVSSDLYAIADRIKEGYDAYKISLQVLSADKSRRYISFTFHKPLGVLFADLQKYKGEALSNAGIDPELEGITFQHGKDNQIQVQIPLQSEEWEPAYLEDFLPGLRSGINKARSSGVKDSVQIVLTAIQEARSLAPKITGDLRIPFLCDFSSNVVDLNLSSGVLLVGSPKGGKSSALDTILLTLAIMYPPDRLRIAALFDFKNGLALRKFDSLPHSERPVITQACDVDAVFEELLEETNAIAQKFAQAGVSEIQDYNALNPNAPLPWKLIAIDEQAEKTSALKEFYARSAKLAKKNGEDDPFEDREPEYWIDKGLRLWRAYGYVFLIGTQDATQGTGLPPKLRRCFGAAIAFRADEILAALAFGGKGYWSKKVLSLGGKGDCILKQEGVHSQGVALYARKEVVGLMLTALAQKDKQWLVSHPRKQVVGFTQSLLSSSSVQPLNRGRSPSTQAQPVQGDLSDDSDEADAAPEEAIEPIPESAPKPVQKSNQELSDRDWERIYQGYEKIKQVRLKRPRWTESLSSLIVVAFGQNANSGGSVKKSRLLLKGLLDKYEPSHPALRQLDSWLSDRKLTEIGGHVQAS